MPKQAAKKKPVTKKKPVIEESKTYNGRRTISNPKFIEVKDELFTAIDGVYEEVNGRREYVSGGIQAFLEPLDIIISSSGLNWKDMKKLSELVTRRILSNFSLLPPNDESMYVLEKELSFRKERKEKKKRK